MADRLSAAASEIALLMAGVALAGGVLALLARLRRSITAPALRVSVAAVSALWLWSIFFLYCVSWAAYLTAGVYLDRESLAFVAPHPVQVLHWVYPPLAFAVIMAATVLSLVVGRWLPAVVIRCRPSFQRSLIVVAGVVAPVCVLSATWTRPAAPLQHLASGVFGGGSSSADPRAASTPPAPDGADGVSRRPIVSMDQYLGGVNRDALRRWNVVMVQVESLRSDQLRAYGGTRDVMPAVDTLARESRVFTNAYIQASHSNLADLVPLSSQYPLRAPIEFAFPEHLVFPRVLLYEVLKDAGYKTAIFSSQNERWGGMINFHRLDKLDRFFDAEKFSGPTVAPYEDLGFAQWVKETGGAGSVDDRYTMDESLKWIDSVGDAPFFLHMNLQSSHLPYVVPAGFPRRFGPKKLDFPIVWGSIPAGKADIVKDHYADSLFYENTQIARLLAHLRERGVWDRTVIVIGGDNGEAFNEHGFSAHASWLFNEVVKVPMIIKAPGLVPGFDDRPAMFLDVPPSVLELLGFPPHPGFQGTSLMGGHPDRNRSIYMIVQTPITYESGIVRGDFKLLMSDRNDGVNFLFDLKQDPGEQNNLAASRPEIFADLAGRLGRWRQEQLDYYADLSREGHEYPPVIQD